MNKKSKPKANLTKSVNCRKEKKYLYLKQALGMGEITATQFTKLASNLTRLIFDRHARRILANTNRILIPKEDII